MNIRDLKIVLVTFVGLLGLVYALQNLVNIDAAFGAVSYVLSRADHVVYPASILPAITSPALVWLALAVIVTGELSVGALSLKGAFDLWRARKSNAATFNSAKTYALFGCGMALVVWFGFFGVISGAFFQQWQTQAGALSLEGAFQLAGCSGIVLLFVNMADDQEET